MFEQAMFMYVLEQFCKRCYENSAAKGFWTGAENDNVPTKIALIHSELSEALEAFRDGDPPSTKPISVGCGVFERPITAMEEELADVLIRLADLCARLNIDLGRVALAKMQYNLSRPHMHGRRV